MTGSTYAATIGLAACGTVVAWQDFPMDILKDLSGLGAFFILVFLIGRRLYGSTDKLTERVVAMTATVGNMEHAIETNTAAQNKVAAALEAFASQQVASNQMTRENQNSLADRNLAEQMKVWMRVEENLVRILAKLADQRRGARGDTGPRRGRERRTSSR